jgi:hypothetical protein
MSVVFPVDGSMRKNILELGFAPYSMGPAQTGSAALISATATTTKNAGRMARIKTGCSLVAAKEPVRNVGISVLPAENSKKAKPRTR